VSGKKNILNYFEKMFCRNKKEYYFCSPFLREKVQEFIDIMKASQAQEQ